MLGITHKLVLISIVFSRLCIVDRPASNAVHVASTHGWYTWLVHVTSTCGWYMWLVHVTGTCGWYMWQVHVTGTCGWYMWQVRVAGTCDWYMSQVHVASTCDWYLWLVHATDTCWRYMQPVHSGKLWAGTCHRTCRVCRQDTQLPAADVPICLPCELLGTGRVGICSSLPRPTHLLPLMYLSYSCCESLSPWVVTLPL